MSEQQPPVKTLKEYVISLRLGVYGGITFLSVLSDVVPTVRIFSVIAVVAYTGYMLIDTFKDYTMLKSQASNATFLTALVHGNMNDFFYLLLSLVIGLIL